MAAECQALQIYLGWNLGSLLGKHIEKLRAIFNDVTGGYCAHALQVDEGTLSMASPVTDKTTVPDGHEHLYTKRYIHSGAHLYRCSAHALQADVNCIWQAPTSIHQAAQRSALCTVVQMPCSCTAG